MTPFDGISPDRRTLVLAALSIGAFAIGASEFSGMTLLPFYAREFGRDQPTAAHAVSLYALGVVVGAPLLALLTARTPRITAAAMLIAATAAANLLTSAANGYGALLLARFLSGIPHGAFFGQAALIAATLSPGRRGTAIAFVMSGLTIATVVGAPAANLLGQTVGWRAGFAIATIAGMISATILAALRRLPVHTSASGAIGSELSALHDRQVLLTLGAGAIGFGGLFAMYAFLPAISTQAGIAKSAVPWVLALAGLGLLTGNAAAGWASDRFGSAAGVILLVWSAGCLALLPVATGHVTTLLPVVFAASLTAGLGPILQVRLMDVAGEAQTLAAALHHAAFNLANALGPWLAGLTITAGYGWSSAGPVGATLALGGLLILLVAIRTAPVRHDSLS